MLPYHALQAAHALISLAVVAVLWAVFGLLVRRLGNRTAWALRTALTAAALGAIALGMLLLATVAGRAIAGFFAAVALVFYAIAFWIPAFVLASSLQQRRTVVAVLALVPPAVALYAMLVEPNRLQVREEHIPMSGWSSGAKPVRLAHLSDLQTVGACARESRALEEVARFDPDLIVMTGDYAAGPFFGPGQAEEAARSFLGSLCKIAPTYLVAGHSESEEIRQSLFAGLPLVYLDDEERSFKLSDARRLRIVGLSPHGPDLRLLRTWRFPGDATVVATHSPDLSPRLDGLGVDLHLAGHTHGGQIVVPGLGAPVTLTALPRRYARGLFRFGDHWLNVCAGLGMEGGHAPRVRLFCPPEICLLTLVGAVEAPARGSD